MNQLFNSPRVIMLVNCSYCHRPWQLPPGASSIRCAACRAITHLGPPPPFSPYNHGRKKAVIVGILYNGELKGCINDAKNMKRLLIHKFQFPESSIIMLTEEETNPYKVPTKHNILRALFWLVRDCQPGDSLVFYYSGHGSQKRNYNGDEVDGYDETLCPLDWKKEGMIVDDEINETIVKPLPYGVKLHAIIDACHSGTVLDLPFLCRMNRSEQYVWEDHRPRNGMLKGSNGGEVISISGCDDDQTSDDFAPGLSKTTHTGVMTFNFIKAIKEGNASTYGSLLNAMRNAIRKGKSDTGGGGGGDRLQEPQLTAWQHFNVYAKPFSL